METLKNEKFSCLSTNEMNEIHGGKWGWAIDSINLHTQQDECWTTTTWTHYNIFGNPNGTRNTTERD